MAVIIIDNKEYQVSEGQNLLTACLSLGFDIPYFCWHPAMHSVGACRLCAVKQFRDEHDSKGKIVMSCMTLAANGVRISIDDDEVRDFRAGIIELLMTNHPHDCPVCDEGGECHLQDMTVMTGHTQRSFRFRKRTHNNQNLGPFVNHEMNRCIACYRCVRFYNDYAGGRDLGVFRWHNLVYFGRHRDGVLENEFSGNLIEVCPTGVFTDKTFKRHYSRPWDLQTAPSICVHCGLGCNLLPGERYGTLRRIHNRYHHEINGYFICDRGRFGYEFVNSEKRIRTPMVKDPLNRTFKSLSREEALERATAIVSSSPEVIGIGSPRASLEANFALRQLVGPDRFSDGFSRSDQQLVSSIIDILGSTPAKLVSILDIEKSDCALILGEDVTATAPRIALALRQTVLNKEIKLAKSLHIEVWEDAAVREAMQQEHGPLYIASTTATKLDDIATRVYHASPNEIARLGFAIAGILDPAAPGVNNMSEEEHDLAGEIARTLESSDKPLIISGSGCSNEAIIRAAADVARALSLKNKSTGLCLTVPECNTLGLGLMGGGDISTAMDSYREKQNFTVILLEKDLYRRLDRDIVDTFLGNAANVIVLDCLNNKTVSHADIVLPAASFAESDGTFVNNEGRAQRYFSIYPPGANIQESWRWLRDIGIKSGKKMFETWETFDDVTRAVSEELIVFRKIPEAAPGADFRIEGQKIPRKTHRYSGRTSMDANRSVNEPVSPVDRDSPLSYSMEGFPGHPPGAIITHIWSPGWNSVQAVDKFQVEISESLKGGDPGIRLIESSGHQTGGYTKSAPEPFTPKDGEWLITPLYHIFGSEELSVFSPGIAELAPKPYIAMNNEDIKLLKATEGDMLTVLSGGRRFQLPLRAVPSLPRGIAGIPAGLPGESWIQYNIPAEIRREKDS
jgi:NADH-quinone oxidoreductase subunit G